MSLSTQQQYAQLVVGIERQTQQLREQRGGPPCPSDCFQCCRNTATMAISAIEAQDLKIGLQKLPHEVQAHILKKAKRTIQHLEGLGYSAKDLIAENVSQANALLEIAKNGMEATNALKGSPSAECPMLVGGVCAVYEHRPVICRVWGYPINNGQELACCYKTFIGERRRFEPIDYAHLWRECRDLSEKTGMTQKTPNCYLVVRLLTESEVRV